MSPRSAVAALCLVVAACASKPPPPPVIETQEAEIGPGQKPREAADESRPGPSAEQPSGASPAPTPLGAAEPGVGSAPQVKLLEAGAEPRRPLRHSFGKATQLLSMKAKTRVKGASLPLPTISLSAPMKAQIVEVNKAGEARFKFEAGPFNSGGGAGAGGGMAGALGGLMGGGGTPEKIAGWGWMTSRGVMKEFHVEEGASEGDAPVETGDPFPEEAVGVGARWEVTSVVQEKDGPVQQQSVYELTQLDKKAAHTKLTRTQTPVGQGDGAATAKSSGELVFRFGEIYPTGRLEMTRTMSLNLPGLDGSAIQLASEVTIGKR